MFTGPVECLFAYCIVIGLKMFGILTSDNMSIVNDNMFTIYLIVLVFVLFSVIKTPDHLPTKHGMLISYALLFSQSVIINYFGAEMIDVFASGFVMVMITADLIISKMAKKELSQMIVVIAIIASINSLIGITFSLMYIIGNLIEICKYLRLHMFMSIRNVYCCGVFDMCHPAHMAMFEKAAQFGDRLIVGIHSGEDVFSYKNKYPTMTLKERCTAVSHCKYVYKVIENAPLTTTEQFMKEHNIHIVVCSSEYFNDDDVYYTDPKRMGVLKMIQRSDMISTTELIKRIETKHTDKETNV